VKLPDAAATADTDELPADALPDDIEQDDAEDSQED